MIEQKTIQNELPNHLKELKPQADSLDQYIDFYARDTRHNAMKHADEHADGPFEYGKILSETIDHYDSIEAANLKHGRTDHIQYDTEGSCVVSQFITPDSEKEPCILYRLKAKAHAGNIKINDPKFNPYDYVDAAKTTYQDKSKLVAAGDWFVNPRDAIDSVLKDKPVAPKKIWRDSSISSIPTIEDMENAKLPEPAKQIEAPIETAKKKKKPSPKPKPGYIEMSGEQLKSLLEEQELKSKDLSDRLKAEHNLDVDGRTIGSSWVKKGVPSEYLEQVKQSLDVV